MTDTERRRVIIYARQSEDISEGITRQLERCRMLAAARGWSVTEEFEDNDTSASKRRGAKTGWGRMLATLDETATVISVDLDRLLRTTQDLVDIMDRRATILTVDGELDLTTADGEFRATMLTGIARFEVRRKSERQLRANEHRAANGRPTAGKRRYGYEVDGIVPREAEAEVVRRIFRHIADGGSVRALATALADEGVSPGTAKAWRPMRVREIAGNPHYGGMMRRLGEVIPSDVIIPIVDPALAEEVRAILSDPSRRTSPGSQPRHPLSGLVSCGECGLPLKYMRGYVCRARPLTGHAHIAASELEPIVLDAVALAFLTTGEALLPSQSRESMIALVRDAQRLEEAALATVQDRDEGLLSAAAARTRLMQIRDEREVAEARLAQARASSGALAPTLAVARELFDGEPEAIPMREALKARHEIVQRLLALDLDRLRETIGALVDVEVAPFYRVGDDARKVRREGERVRVWHKVATHLNPDTVDETDLDGASNGPGASGAPRRAPSVGPASA